MEKSQRTKKQIYAAAIKLFLQDGFEKTTVRGIAREAGVAPGAMYYYYPSKESVVQAYYEQSHDDHEALLGDFFESNTGFEERLHHMVTTKIQVALPYKDLARVLYRVAADPRSPSSPFSEESKELRHKALAICETVVEGSDEKFHSEIKSLLPGYLWFYEMGIILFWIYDESKDSEKTFELIDQTVPLIGWMNKTVNSSWALPFRKKIIGTLQAFAPQKDKVKSNKEEK